MSSLVMVMVAIGSVVMNFAGSAVLTSTDVVVDGARANSAAGVFGYVGIASGAFVIAAVLVVLLVRRQGRAGAAAPEPAVHHV